MLLRSLVALCTLAASSAAFAESSASYTSFPESVNSGGGSAASTNYSTSFTIGQPFAAGTMSSASYQGGSGFWQSMPTSAPASAQLSPGSADFGSIADGSTSNPPTTFTLSNVGGSALNVTTVNLTGANTIDFQVTNNCTAAVAGGSSCTIDVRFAPQVGAGIRSASLNVGTDDPSHPNLTASLTGLAVQAYTLTVTRNGAGTGSVTSSPAGIDCGATCAAAFASGTPVTLTAVASSGSAFTLWSGCDSVAGNQCTITVNAAAGVTATFATANPASVDWNGDGHPDILWSNTANGATYVWYMGGTPPALISDAFIAQIDPSWQVQGVADFNGDGHPDLVWRNTTNGNCYVWYMNGTSFIVDAFLFSLPPQWVIQGVADFNGDGHPDFFMRNTDPASGVGFAWYFNNATAIGSDFLFGIDPVWKVEAVADINGDGQPDLLFRNSDPASGLSFAWFTQYSGGVLSLAGSTPPLYSIDPVWEVVQLADWNGDGKPDLLFRNATTGVVFVWYVNTDNTLGGSDFIIQIDPSWEIVPRR